MSEFDRTEAFRRSIRRKPLAPQPPQGKPPPINTPSDVSSLVKKLLINKRDFVASPPVPTSIPSPSQPRIISMTPKEPADDDDASLSTLMAIQKQINQIEFNSAVQRNNVEPPKVEVVGTVTKTRYHEMESLLNTGISDMESVNGHDDDDNDINVAQFYRGGDGRSSIQGVPGSRNDPKKIKPSRPVGRTASDTRQIELVRKQRKRVDDKPSPDQVKQI